MRTLLSFVLALALLSVPAYAGQLQEGTDAALLGKYDTAVRLLRPLAEQGDAQAEYYIGTMYRHGQGGLKKDLPTAMRWLLKSANQGDGEAQFEVSTMYRNGEGVKQDYAEAYFWKSLAKKAGTAIIDEEPGYVRWTPFLGQKKSVS